MPWYEIAKAVHFLGFIALFGFFVVYARAGPRLRSATTLHEARLWLSLLVAIRGMFAGGAGLFLLSGIVMAALRWRGPFPFMVVGFTALLFMWALWLIVGSRHLRAIRGAMSDREGPIPPELARTILDPRPWSVMAALNGAALGVLFVMTLKLGWAGAIGMVLGAAAIGAVVGGVIASRGKVSAAA